VTSRSRIRLALPVIVLLIGWTSSRADRFYGNLGYSYLHLSQSAPSGDTLLHQTDDLTQETAILNYEDALFTKNLLRLGANLSRREYSFTSYHEFRPIFYLDLRSYGYTLSSSYSPYNRLVTDVAGGNLYHQYFREWRTSATTNVPKWPTFGLTYNSNRSWYEGTVGKRDSRNTNFVAQSSFTNRGFSYQAAYNRLKTKNLETLAGSNTRTLSSTVGFARNSAHLGSVSTSYGIYTTRRLSNDILDITTRTHSVSAMYSSPQVARFSGSASYSGRYFRTEHLTLRTDNRTEVFAGQLTYAPTGYLSFDATKGYQIGTETGRNQISEYVALSANVTRYLRQGIDTRMAATRTIFQQADRAVQVDDETATQRGRYTLDTYYGSLRVAPYNYLKTYLDASLSHNSNPIDPHQRYQATGSIDTRMNFSRATEGRFSYSSLFQGRSFRLGHTYSHSYNAGLTYIPRSNINVNVTYIYTTYNAAVRTENGSFTGYISYGFRRAFTIYVSVNQQEQTRIERTGVPVTQHETTLRPRTVNSQLIMYLSRRTTLSASYLYGKSPSLTTGATTTKSVQAVLNIQV